MTRFLDTSAVVKIYHEEEGSRRMMEIYDSSDTELMISELGVVEFRSAALRKYREGEIDDDALGMVNQRFSYDLAQRYGIVDFSPVVTDEAVRHLDAHGRRSALRTLDAFQLAFFLSYCDINKDKFVTYDKTLRDVANTIGIDLN